jgi:hypothetical protein
MTSDAEMDPAVFARMFQVAFDPEIVRCMNAIRQLADYDIAQDRAASFLRFHRFITSPQPRYIADWRADPKLERKWYHSHVNGVLGDVRGALAAAHYHASHLGEMEAKVSTILANSSFRERLGNSVMGLGGTRKMDFEYHAFVLAYRRCLDYLAGALASYFKTEASSFRTFPKSITNSKMPDVAKSLCEAHARHVQALAFVLAEGRKSVRHRIAHYDFVSAGCVNLTPQGFFLAGGGEELAPPGHPRGATLAAALDERLDRLHVCVDDMIDSFVEAARTREAGLS